MPAPGRAVQRSIANFGLRDLTHKDGSTEESRVLIAEHILGVIETYGVALTSASWRSILLYGVFVLVLMFRPQGLFGARAIVR